MAITTQGLAVPDYQSMFSANDMFSFHSDVNWRAGHLGIKANYWNMAASDMPWQLSEGIAMGGFGGPTVCTFQNLSLPFCSVL